MEEIGQKDEAGYSRIPLPIFIFLISPWFEAANRSHLPLGQLPLLAKLSQSLRKIRHSYLQPLDFTVIP